jgi:hypothetical protein
MPFFGCFIMCALVLLHYVSFGFASLSPSLGVRAIFSLMWMICANVYKFK